MVRWAATRAYKRAAPAGSAETKLDSLGNAPGRAILPCLQDVGRPRRGLILVAQVARIRNLQCFALRRRDKAEGVGAHVYVVDRLRDFRHVAGNTLVAGAARLVMSEIGRAHV